MLAIWIHFFTEALSYETNHYFVPLDSLFSFKPTGEETWRERVSRRLPWSAAYKTRKAGKTAKKRIRTKTEVSMNPHELRAALDSELRGNTNNVSTLEEMKVLARQEIYARIARNEQDEILQILFTTTMLMSRVLKARLSSILNDEKMASPNSLKSFRTPPGEIPPERTKTS